MRNVYGVSTWPESYGEEFLIFKNISPFETDEQAIARAKKQYSSSLEVIVKEVNHEQS